MICLALSSSSALVSMIILKLGAVAIWTLVPLVTELTEEKYNRGYNSNNCFRILLAIKVNCWSLFSLWTIKSIQSKGGKFQQKTPVIQLDFSVIIKKIENTPMT